MLTDSARPDEQGFSLIELLVIMVILGVLGAMVTTSVVQGMRVSDQADRRVEALTDLQRAGQRISRELRMACSVEATSAHEAVVDVLRDDDPATDDYDPDRYRYLFRVDGDVLVADVDLVAADGTTTDVRTERVAGGITNGASLFAYRDGDGGAPEFPSDVRDITVTLHRLVDGDVVEWTADLHLRNGGVPCEL